MTQHQIDLYAEVYVPILQHEQKALVTDNTDIVKGDVLMLNEIEGDLISRKTGRSQWVQVTYVQKGSITAGMQHDYDVVSFLHL